MWVAKIKLNGENAIIGSRCKKFNVSVSGYPVSNFCNMDCIYTYAFYFIYGDEENIKFFIKDMKKDERVLHIENKGNFIVSQIKEPEKYKKVYSHDLIHLKPLIINRDGTQFWTLGSWNKKSLNDFIKLAEKVHNGELLSIKEEKIDNFSIFSMQPNLTIKQKKALETAIANRYYEYPRKTELKKLAKLRNLSYSTYHAHLRKAEQKLFPFLFENIDSQSVDLCSKDDI